MLREIKFDQYCTAGPDELRANMAATIKRGYEGLADYIGGTHEVLSVVGAAPSLAETYTQLLGHTMAINSAHGWLLSRGVVPHLTMLWDASPLIAQFAVPHPQTIFVVAARCHPSVFDRLAGCRVVVWFADGDEGIKEWLADQGINEPLIAGGSSGITRAMFLGVALGYRQLHMFGADSSYTQGRTHINGSLVAEEEMQVWLTPEGDGPGWRTTGQWCQQCKEYVRIVNGLRRLGVTIDCYGEGMLPEVHRRLAA